MIFFKEICGTIAVVLNFFAFIPLIISIKKGKVKPHLISWIIWSIATITVFIAQVYKNAGYGALSIGVSGLLCLFVVYLAYVKKGDYKITKLDYFFLFLSLFAILLWVFTKDPVYSVVILVFVDVCGGIPVFLKAYKRPYEESMSIFVICAVRNAFSLLALQSYSIVTTLFQVVTGILNVVLVSIIFFRRRCFVK